VIQTYVPSIAMPKGLRPVGNVARLKPFLSIRVTVSSPELVIQT